MRFAADMVLFDILRYSFSSIIWGVLIAVVCLVLFVLLIKGWYKDATFSLVSYLVGIVLFVLLSVQSVLVVGSLKIIDMSDVYEHRINKIVEGAYSSYDELSLEQASDIIDEIIEEYPILQYYIGGGEISGYTAKELPHAIAQELRSFMRWYIFRRILWCLGFVIIGAVCVILSMSGTYHRRHKYQRSQYKRERVNRRLRR